MFGKFLKTSLVGLAMAIGCSVASAQTGWQPQAITDTSNMAPLQTTPDGSCANFDQSKVVSCVYWQRYDPGVNDQTNIVKIDSADGGATWGTPYWISWDTGQDYNPYITYDWYHKQFIVTYSKWHNNQGGTGNDLVMTTFPNATGLTGQTTPVMIAGGDGQSYWEGSTIVLNDGNLLSSYAINGPESNEGVYSGRIGEKLSTNGGTTWGSQINQSSLCNAEFPRAYENASGLIVTVYSRYVDTSADHLPFGDNNCADFVDSNGYPQTDIHMVESTNDGASWTADYDLYHNPNNSSALHPSIGMEGFTSASACGASCKIDMSFVTGNGSGTFNGTYGIYDIYSTNGWASITGPVQYGTSTWTTFLNINPSITLTCTGFLLAYTDAGSNGQYGQNQYNLRYIAWPGCTGE